MEPGRLKGNSTNFICQSTSPDVAEETVFSVSLEELCQVSWVTNDYQNDYYSVHQQSTAVIVIVEEDNQPLMDEK